MQELAQQLLDSPPPDPDAARRRDLTHLPVCTIDDDSTTEIDDGLSIERWVALWERTEGGHSGVGVCPPEGWSGGEAGWQVLCHSTCRPLPLAGRNGRGPPLT